MDKGKHLTEKLEDKLSEIVEFCENFAQQDTIVIAHLSCNEAIEA